MPARNMLVQLLAL